MVNRIFADYQELPGSTLLIGALLFAFQIYGDFSGYSDIAIGTARLFGFRLMQNFRVPYFSRDIAEFWRRWHISLNTWFRDYIYIPLGGSRVSKAKVIRNTFIIFLVSGFWHGANWTFLAWGAYHALLFMPLILMNRNRHNTDTAAEGRMLPSLREAASMTVTFALVVVGWILFRAETIGDAWHYLQGICSRSLLAKPVGYGEEHMLWQTFAFILVLLIVEWIQRNREHGLALDRVRSAPCGGSSTMPSSSVSSSAKGWRPSSISSSDMKRFLVRTFIGAIPLLLLVLGSLYYYFRIRPELTGDLGQLGKIAFGTEYDARIGKPLLADRMVRPYEPGAPVGRIVTIGDSFSQQEEGLSEFSGSPARRTRNQYPADSGRGSGAGRPRPAARRILRHAARGEMGDRRIGRTGPGRPLSEAGTRPHPEASPLLRDGDGPTGPESSNGLLGRAFRQSKDWMLLRTGLAANPVCSAALSRPCFTLPGRESTLYFYRDDLDRLSVSDDELAAMRESLRTLHDRFRERGIELFYLMAVDKYELYQHLIAENPYPQRLLGTRLRELDSLEFFIDPLPRLRERLDAGETDLYLGHDTHWSQKGAALAADLLCEKILDRETEHATTDDENRPNFD